MKMSTKTIPTSIDDYFADMKRKIGEFLPHNKLPMEEKIRTIKNCYPYVVLKDNKPGSVFYDFCQENFGDLWIWNFEVIYFTEKENLDFFVLSHYDEILETYYEQNSIQCKN